MKERRAIAPIKPVCLEGPVCFASTAHGPSSSSKQLLPSSLLLLSPTFSGSPLNLMVPSSSASRPCDSWRASVLYYTTLPQWVCTPLSSDLCFCHTHGPHMYTQTCRDRNTPSYTHTYTHTHTHTHTECNPTLHQTNVTHIYTGILDVPHTHTSHMEQIYQHTYGAQRRHTRRTHTYTHTLVPHSHNTRAFTHSWCSATVTLDTGSPPPRGGCHVGMRHTDITHDRVQLR